MKSILISIYPQWCEKIANGEKTIEIRKTKPKIDTPFKCYIYCTIGNGVRKDYLVQRDIQRGKVVGEFICDKIVKYRYTKPWLYNGKKIYHLPLNTISTCLSYNEIEKYLGNKDGYGWNISELKIYDKPKELSEFYRFCNEGIKRPPQSYMFVEGVKQ